MSTFLTKGIIIKKDSYGEYDRQYVIYSKDRGKILAVAKGAQKTASKLACHLEPFSVVDLMLAEGNNFFRVAGVGSVSNYGRSWEDLKKKLMVFYFFDLLDTLIRYDFSDQDVFDRSVDFLSEISSANGLADSLLSLNRGLFDLFSYLGYCPVISADNQKSLLDYFNDLALQVGDQEIKSFYMLRNIF